MESIDCETDRPVISNLDIPSARFRFIRDWYDRFIFVAVCAIVPKGKLSLAYIGAMSLLAILVSIMVLTGIRKAKKKALSDKNKLLFLGAVVLTIVSTTNAIMHLIARIYRVEAIMPAIFSCYEVMLCIISPFPFSFGNTLSRRLPAIPQIISSVIIGYFIYLAKGKWLMLVPVIMLCGAFFHRKDHKSAGLIEWVISLEALAWSMALIL